MISVMSLTPQIYTLKRRLSRGKVIFLKKTTKNTCYLKKCIFAR